MAAFLAPLLAWAKNIRRDAVALWFVSKDPRTPVWVRCLVWLVVAYALSPIDLIPDFIPVLGLLDEAILLPIAIWLAARSVPPQVMADARSLAMTTIERPKSRIGMFLIMAIWLLCAYLLIRWLAGQYFPGVSR
jgi:uncharacterized membrane protein YkvA (DUF1232 family)